jgi:hypothetical protein
MNLCKYRHIFGKEKEGVHSFRILNIAIVDVLMTIIAGFIISYYANISFLKTTLALFALGIALHRLFCVRTTIDKLLFNKGHAVL